MNIEITKQERNELLEREDIELAIDHTGEATPAESDVRSQLAAELDLDPETIRIDHIHGSAGTGRATGEVKVFDKPVVDLSEDSEDDEADDEDSGGGAVGEVAVDIDTDDESGEDEEKDEEESDEDTEEDESAETDNEESDDSSENDASQGEASEEEAN